MRIIQFTQQNSAMFYKLNERILKNLSIKASKEIKFCLKSKCK